MAFVVVPAEVVCIFKGHYPACDTKLSFTLSLLLLISQDLQHALSGLLFGIYPVNEFTILIMTQNYMLR